jgi:hypothetical protein
MASPRRVDPPHEVQAIRVQLENVLNSVDPRGRRVGDAKMGVYAFYDYDGEPIYVGRTAERLRTRIRRHLTNQRTDAVAMNVLDPFEVAEVEMWPFWDLEREASSHANATLESAESTVYEMLLEQSVFSAVLNEVPVTQAPSIPLPESTRQRIIPDDVYDRRLHPDVRIARRANTIARLAQVISERAVQPGLRQVLVTQARRLQHLAERRLEETHGDEGGE